MKPIIKNQYYNGRETVLEIYHNTHKILEKNGTLWNATEENPITVTKEKYSLDHYILSDIELETECFVEEVEDEQ